MLYSINDVCKNVFEDYGETMSPYWLASQMVEARMWKANEHEVQVALDEEIKKFGESARCHAPRFRGHAMNGKTLYITNVEYDKQDRPTSLTRRVKMVAEVARLWMVRFIVRLFSFYVCG